MRVMKPLAVITAAAALLAACAAPQPRIQSNFDKTADFSRYRTYNIMDTAGRVDKFRRKYGR